MYMHPYVSVQVLYEQIHHMHISF